MPCVHHCLDAVYHERGSVTPPLCGSWGCVQGKSSCMPAHALNPCKGWKVLDCCAAPGNKTTHLSALVGDKGSVIAFEKDQSRFETLKRTLARCKAFHAQPVLGVRLLYTEYLRKRLDLTLAEAGAWAWCTRNCTSLDIP